MDVHEVSVNHVTIKRLNFRWRGSAPPRPERFQPTRDGEKQPIRGRGGRALSRRVAAGFFFKPAGHRLVGTT